jgi:hypothetical protein
MSGFDPVFFPPLGPAKGSSGAVAPRGWNRCTLNGKVIPGFCRITRGNIRLKVDPKKKSGANGANPTFHGIDPQAIELEITTTSDEDREALVGIIGPLVPQANRDPAPVSIDAPSLRLIGISSVQVIGVGALLPVEGQPMKARMVIDMLHWLPPNKKVATKTPTGAPVRKPKNERTGHPATPTPPTQQPGVAGPPANFSSGR